MNYILGASGFLGKHISQKVRCTAIPHQEIPTTELKQFDNLYYLASYGNLIHQTDISETIKANTLDVAHIIDQAVKYDFKSFIFISTSSVKLKVQTSYSRAKRATEEILLAYLEKYNKPVCIIRPFSITGVGEQKEHLIPKLIHSCMTGEPMNFVGNPTHDFIDVDDIVSGILNLSEHSARGIFELGTGKSYSNDQVLEIVERVTGKKANINRVESMRKYDNENWVSSNYRARSWGWMPTKSLEVSIKEMYESAKKTNT